MHILRREAREVAVIDPKRKIGEDGQYVRYMGNSPGLDDVIKTARKNRFEIRSYVENLEAFGGGVIPIKYIITEIPPMHVQPFHYHTNVEEINLISSGSAYFVESEVIAEDDIETIRKDGILIHPGDVVVSEPGKRHTVANLSDSYTHIIAILSEKRSVAEFKPDWKR